MNILTAQEDGATELEDNDLLLRANSLGRLPLDKFNLDAHVRCWRKYKVRPSKGGQNPEATDWKFCTYDKVHKDYGYTQAWVDFLVEKLKDDAEFASLREATT